MTAIGDAFHIGPDFELNRPDLDFGLTYQQYGPLQGFRLSTGDRLWSEVPYAPCTSLVLSGGHAYGHCGTKLLSYEIATGSLQVVKDSGVAEIATNESMVAVLDVRGRLQTFDSLSNRPLAKTTLPKFKESWRVQLIAPASVVGVCLLRIDVLSNHPAYGAGCYDVDLRPIWTQAVLNPVSRDEPVFDVRQRGPYHLILDDQYQPLEPDNTDPKGRGLVLRWRDGAVTRFTDATYATLEDDHGERNTNSLAVEVFKSTVGLVHEYEKASPREARVVREGDRIFVLARNDSTGLAAIDANTGKNIFVVQVPLGGRFSLEVTAGYPIVRTNMRSLWYATIHDPRTGRVLYRDVRRNQ